MPVGSAAVGLWGVPHTALDRQYGVSMLAVDATTGREKWVCVVVSTGGARNSPDRGDYVIAYALR